MDGVSEGLDDLLESSSQPGPPELHAVLQEVVGGCDATARLIRQQRLKAGVYRLQFEVNGSVRSLVLKRLDLNVAYHNQRVAQRWLPALGLRDSGPALLGVAAERSGRCVWHLYEDLGGRTLAASDADPRQVEAAVAVIAQLHTRSAGHALLPEWRWYGGDLGISFYTSNVRDAIHSLEALHPPAVELSPERVALRDGLLARLHHLLDEQPYRAQVMADVGGPDVLLHGDLWTTNVLVCSTGNGLHARLIDWDRAGVGPVSYDLSTFLYRFPPAARPWILDLYQDEVRHFDWCLPSAADLNLLFDTAEQARLANRVMWAAIALWKDHAEWSFDELAAFAHWLDVVTPVLPQEHSARNSAGNRLQLLREIDLACLADRWSSEIVRQCGLEYQQARWPDGSPAAFERRLAVARLYVHFRWLGDRPEWTTHKHYWRFEHLRSAGERLGRGDESRE